MRSSTFFGGLTLAIAIAVAPGGGVSAPADASAADMPGQGQRPVKMARATWDTGWWQGEVYRQLLQKLGYEVGELTTLDNPPFYQAVAQGDMDLWANGNFPLHNPYEPTFSKGAEKVGYESKVIQGYLIDKKTADKYGIKYLSDMKKPDIAKLFDSNGDGKANMVACPPGWGCEKLVSYQIDAYGLGDSIDLIKAAYSAAMADVFGRYKNGEPIFFYTWTPNWTTGILEPGKDVVWLQVKEVKLPKEQADFKDTTAVKDVQGCPDNPCQMGQPPYDIRVVANSAFLKDNPAASTARARRPAAPDRSLRSHRLQATARSGRMGPFLAA